MHYIKDTQIAARLGVSRATIWRWSKEGSFPAPIKLGSACTRWKMCEIEKWENSRSGDNAQ